MKLSKITPRKFIESYPGNGKMISTPKGEVEILEVHKTIPYKKYKIVLDNGMFLECAYNHVLINNNNKEVYAKNCLNEILQTEKGDSKVISVINLNTEENMYDVTLASKEEVYYSNGILSHNSGKSVTVSIYLCWLALFEKDVNIGIAAQSLGMAAEFLTKVKDIFVSLPIWMTPGVKVWNVRSVSFENGVRILSDTAGKNSFRGFTCLRGDTKIDILENGVEKSIKIEDLYTKIKSKSVNNVIRSDKEELITYKKYLKYNNILGKYVNLKIKTKNGYKSFDGIKKVKEQGINLLLENTQINCTKSHRIFVGKSNAGKIFRQAKNIKINNKINGQKLLKIMNDSEHFYYDPINVEGDNTYIVDNIIHHNCAYTVTDESAYIIGNDNGTTKFSAYLDSMLPSQSALSKKKNIFISTANGMNEFYTLYTGALKDGFTEVTEILNSDHIIYSDTIENHFNNEEIYNSQQIKNIKKLDNNKYEVTYNKRKIGSNGSIAFNTDWRKVPRWNQDGTKKSPEQFKEEIIASKGEIFFNQAYANCVEYNTIIKVNNKNVKIGELWESL